MKKILVSECLYGGRPVRYDGAETPCRDPIFLKWKSEGRLVPVCPETLGGLPTPRPESQRVGGKVLTKGGRDMTAAFEKGAESALRTAREHGAAFAVLKDGSPSCGVHAVHDGTFSGAKIPGSGLAAERLTAAGYKVFSECELTQAVALLKALERQDGSTTKAPRPGN